MKAWLRLEDLCPGWLPHIPIDPKLHISQSMDVSTGLLECPYNMAAAFLQNELPKTESKLEVIMPFPN